MGGCGSEAAFGTAWCDDSKVCRLEPHCVLIGSLTSSFRDRLREVLHDHFDDEFARRFIGFSHNGIVRVPLDALGPWHKKHFDGHEKLNGQALGMGELQFGIYAGKDGYSSHCSAMRVMPNVRSEEAIAHFFLDMTEAYDCKWIAPLALKGLTGATCRPNPTPTHDR